MTSGAWARDRQTCEFSRSKAPYILRDQDRRRTIWLRLGIKVMKERTALVLLLPVLLVGCGGKTFDVGSDGGTRSGFAEGGEGASSDLADSTSGAASSNNSRPSSPGDQTSPQGNGSPGSMVNGMNDLPPADAANSAPSLPIVDPPPADAVPPPAPVTINMTMCGSTPCDRTTSVCCVGVDDAGSGTVMCAPTGQCPSGSPIVASCSSAASCTNHEVCCLEKVGPDMAIASCQLDCGSSAPSLELCATSAECASGDTCQSLEATGININACVPASTDRWELGEQGSGGAGPR